MDMPFVLTAAARVALIILTLYGTAVVLLTGALFRRFKPAPGAAEFAGGGFPGVSVVIPFRNEEQNLRALLESLGNQSYKGAVEVILVNDRSDDNGIDVIKNYLQDNGRITVKIIDLQPSGDIGLTSKQQALDLGAAQSSHPLIALTDADMILAPNWIESLVNSRISSGSDLVFGHTSIIADNRNRLFTLLESYQLEFLFSFAYAFSKLNLAGSCMGNNILVLKESYLKCGGQRGVGYSIVEDKALLALMRKKGFRVSASEPFTVTARTYPSRSKSLFFSQMMRWAAGGLRPGGGLFAAGLLLLAQNTLLALSAIGLICQLALPPSMILPVPILIRILSVMLLGITNFFLTWLFLTLSFRKHRSPIHRRLMYPVYYLFLAIETVVFAALLVFRPKIKWKGREL